MYKKRRQFLDVITIFSIYGSDNSEDIIVIWNHPHNIRVAVKDYSGIAFVRRF